MLQAANQVVQGYLTVLDIDNFPCEDLRTIDHLWLHYSRGKFGFSVQTAIYRRLGCTREYNEGVWEDFGDTVGWRQGGNWVNYNDITFNTSALWGHLPLGVWCYVECVFDGVSSLASRLVKCSI